MQNYPVRLLQEMLETYSPSGSEAALARLLRSEMDAQGFRTKLDNAGNVIGEVGREGPRVLLCGHMDTIPGELPVRLEGGFLYGRGAVDAKSSLATMMLGCILARERSTLPFQATLAGVVEEETTSKGIKAIICEDRPYDLAVFGEPSGTSNIIVGYKGSLKLEATCMTKGGHSASPWLSKSGFGEMVSFWETIRTSLLDNDAPSKFSTVTGCVTKFVAGDQGNTIPSKTSMEVDIRIPQGVKAANIVRRVEELRQLYEEKNADVRIFISVKDQTEPYVADQNSIGIRAFRSAIRKVTTDQTTFVKKTGTSDMNLFAESSKIPMLAYGPGDSRLDHTDQERISIGEYQNSIEVYATALEKFSILARESPVLSTVRP